MPAQPKLLNYANAQFLVIGEGQDDLAKAGAPEDSNKKEEDTPVEEMEKLEHEDEIRVKHLNGQ